MYRRALLDSVPHAQQGALLIPGKRQGHHANQPICVQFQGMVDPTNPLHDVRRQKRQLNHPRHVGAGHIFLLCDSRHTVKPAATEPLEPVVRFCKQTLTRGPAKPARPIWPRQVRPATCTTSPANCEASTTKGALVYETIYLGTLPMRVMQKARKAAMNDIAVSRHSRANKNAKELFSSIFGTLIPFRNAR